MRKEDNEFNYKISGNDKNLYVYIQNFKSTDHIARFTITEPINTFEDIKRLLHEAIDKGLTEIEEDFNAKEKKKGIIN